LSDDEDIHSTDKGKHSADERKHSTVLAEEKSVVMKVNTILRKVNTALLKENTVLTKVNTTLRVLWTPPSTSFCVEGGGGTVAKSAMTGWQRIEGSLLEFKMYNKFEKLETKKLTQQVLNGQIGSPKSFKFEEFFSQEKHRLRTLIFLKMFPDVPNFNPQKQKPAISVCGPRQLIVNSRRSSQNIKMSGAVFTTQRKWIIYT
jgi:hypothetical protein